MNWLHCNFASGQPCHWQWNIGNNGRQTLVWCSRKGGGEVWNTLESPDRQARLIYWMLYDRFCCKINWTVDSIEQLYLSFQLQSLWLITINARPLDALEIMTRFRMMQLPDNNAESHLEVSWMFNENPRGIMPKSFIYAKQLTPRKKGAK